MIIYPTSDGGIAVIVPSGALPADDVARKDVPAGVPYRIVAVSDIPFDRSERALWTADLSNPDGYGIGAEAWIVEQEAINVSDND